MFNFTASGAHNNVPVNNRQADNNVPNEMYKSSSCTRNFKTTQNKNFVKSRFLKFVKNLSRLLWIWKELFPDNLPTCQQERDFPHLTRCPAAAGHSWYAQIHTTAGCCIRWMSKCSITSAETSSLLKIKSSYWKKVKYRQCHIKDKTSHLHCKIA